MSSVGVAGLRALSDRVHSEVTPLTTLTVITVEARAVLGRGIRGASTTGAGRSPLGMFGTSLLEKLLAERLYVSCPNTN